MEWEKSSNRQFQDQTTSLYLSTACYSLQNERYIGIVGRQASSHWSCIHHHLRTVWQKFLVNQELVTGKCLCVCKSIVKHTFKVCL